MLLTFISAGGTVNAQHSDDKAGQSNVASNRQGIEGSWQGVLNSGVGKLRLVLKVSKASDGALKASMDSPDQGATNLPVDTITFKDAVLHFEMKQIEANFDGGLSRDGSEVSGLFRQGLSSALLLKREGSVASSNQPAGPALTRGIVKLGPCNIPVVTSDAGCGKFEVFEDRAAKTGRKIALNILVLPALSPKPAADPVFVIAGGPGQGAVSLVKGLGDYLIKLRRERDIVFVDQRGTGESNPLACGRPSDNDEMRNYFTEGVDLAKLRECRAQLEKNANLALYTTPIAMDDLDDVRAALGYDKVNLLGGSYGTFAGFVYMRQHANHVRSAILEGVSPVDARIYLPFAKGVEHSLERMFADCAADKECNQAFPKLRAEFKELTAKIEKQPAVFESTNLISQKREQVTLSRNIFSEQIRTLLYIPIYWRWLPLLIHEANANNFGPLASIAYANVRGLTGQIANGMSLSVVCAEDVPFVTEEDIKQNTAGTFYGDYRVRTVMKACEQWPKGKVSDTFSQPVKSDVPTLMITGDLDPVAPAWLATGAARFLPNSRQISIHNTGHYFRFECLEDLFVEFLSKASVKGLDDSCVKDIELPPFITKLPPQLAK